MRQVRHTAIVAVLLVLAGMVMGKTLRVPTADYPTIQAAIDDAASGDKIKVAPGTYQEAIDFRGKAIHLYSDSGPADTTIDGTGHQVVVMCDLGVGPDAILEGFTITGASGGAGMYSSHSSPTVTDCVFTNNSIDGMTNYFSSPTVTNCSFERNANGMYNGEYSHPTMRGCTFRENSGDGMSLYAFVEVTVTDCIFADNGDAGMYSIVSGGTVTNCTFVNNSGGGMSYKFAEDFSPTLTNCILWSNACGPIVGDPGIITYSDVEGGWTGEGNIDADPLLVDASGGDFHLALGSPCIDAGTNSPAGGLPATDIEGNRRPIDGDGDRVAVADMGACEASKLRGPRK